MNKNRIHSVYLRCLQRQQRQEVDTNKGATLVEHTVYRGGLVYEGGNLRFTQGTEWRVILTKSLSVMPGDRVSVTAYAKYMNLSGDGNPNACAAALTAAFGVSSGSTGEQFKLYNNLNTYGLSMAGGEHPGDDDTAPKAFVTILLLTATTISSTQRGIR